jgi:ribosomal-protein-serine acetyltransferase
MRPTCTPRRWSRRRNWRRPCPGSAETWRSSRSGPGAAWAAEAWDRGEHYELAIFAGHAFVGSAGLAVDAKTNAANLQYWVRTSATRRGVASEAIRLVARWGIQTLGLQRVEIFISDHNVASQMAARKSGAHVEGVLRNKIRWDERPFDAHIFSFVPSDFA